MKKSDIIAIVLVAMVGVFASAFFVNLLMGNPDDAKASYKNIEVVEPGLAEPDAEVFNSDAINPTIEVYVGDCIDVDQDGALSQAELVSCGRIDNIDDSSDESSDENSDEDETSDTEETVVETTDIMAPSSFHDGEE